MTSIYQGDPLLSNSGSGLTITVKGGQPKLDNGLTNAVLLSLFHDPWFMNSVIEDELQHIGSDFTSYIASNPITVSNLNTARSIAIKSLQWLIDDHAASEIDVRLRNPNGSIIQVLVLVKPPGKTAIAILATKYGLNWKIQLSETTKS
jgi:phage gp46-like protein